MPQDSAPKESPKEQTPKFRAIQPEAPSIYINNANFGMTEADITVDIGEIYSVIPEEQIFNIVPRARLIMSVPFAFRFLIALKTQLDKHQQVKAQLLEESKRAAADDTAK